MDTTLVRVTTDKEALAGCKLLAKLRASSAKATTSARDAATEIALRQKTAKLGGDTVLILSLGLDARGEAYRCGLEAPPK